MAAESTVQELVEYYSNLLIVQYHNKPRAKAIIELFVRELLASGIAFDVRDGYSVETAVGAQLDIIGKYVGVDRFYKNQDLHDFFALVEYDEISGTISPEKWGFLEYSNFNTVIENGTLNYNSVLTKDFKLTDSDYRTLIKLKIVQNTSNHSHRSIDDSMFKFFGTDVIPDSQGDMHMYYFVPLNMSEVIRAALDKAVLPRPMGVGLGLITQSSPFYGFSTYTYANPNITGFTRYNTYDSKSGETLDYDKINYGGI